VSFEDDTSASAAADITVEEHSNAGDAFATSGGAATANTKNMDNKVRDKVFGTLNLRPQTKEYLQNNLEKLEEILQLLSDEIKDKTYDKEGKKHAIFNQAERDTLILLHRWMEENRGDDEEVKWEDYNVRNFNAFVLEQVPKDILDEILKELLLDDVRVKINDKKVFTPASFVEKSKYWYEHEINLNSTDIHEIEKFKKWYKHRLDTYLPSDWIVSFRKEAAQVNDLEWRNVLKGTGLKADAIHALEINDVCDFATLNHTFEKWRITKHNGDVSNSDWNEWQKMGLKENDARNIINFRHWYNFYVVGTKNKSDWATEFHSKQYKTCILILTN